MSKIYKIVLILAVIALIIMAADFALAGQGYFLEKGQEFFIFDNLYINGYLTVGRDLLNRTGQFGDVLANNFELDPNSSFIFCKDRRQAQTNAPINRDCAEKVMVWYPEAEKGLTILDPGFYQAQANEIIATNKIIFNAANQILTNNPVRVINGCFSNRANALNCGGGELKTNKLYINNLAPLDPDDTFDITFNATNIDLGEIDLGRVGQFKRHNGSGGFCQLGCSKSWTAATFTKNGLSSALTLSGPPLCCYLKVNF